MTSNRDSLPCADLSLAHHSMASTSYGPRASLPPLQPNPMADVSLFRRGRRVLMSLALLAWAAFIFGSHFIVWVFPLALIMIFFWDKPFHKLIIKVGTTWSRSLTHFGFLRIYATIDPAVYAAVRKAKVRIVVSNHRAELDLVSLPALIGVLDPARCGEQFAIANNVLVERVSCCTRAFIDRQTSR